MKKFTFGDRLSYGFGDFASNLGNASMNCFIIYYYTNVAHIASSIAGTMMLIVLLIDSVADVVVGISVDKTHTRFGKARPWILCMFLPFTIFFIMMFSVPEGTDGTKIAFAFFTLLFFNLLYSATNIPYGILNSLITKDQYERSLFNLFRMFLAYGATILVNAETLKIASAFGGGRIGWQLTAVTYALVGAVLFFLTFLFTREGVNDGAGHESVPLKTGFKALFKNNYWLILMLYGVCFYIYFSINNAATVFYLQIAIGNTGLQNVVSFAFYIPIVLGMLVLAPLIKRFGKRNLTLAGIFIVFAGTALLFVNPSSPQMLIVSTLIKGIGMSPILGCFFAMVADTIEYGHWKTGVRTEGLTYSATSFGVKAGSGIGTAIASFGLSLGGYTATAAKQSASTLFAIKIVYIVLPLILFAIIMIILKFYQLDKKYKLIEIKN